MQTKFKIVDIKKYTAEELYSFRDEAILLQGSDENFSQKLENRINMINGELIKKGESI